MRKRVLLSLLLLLVVGCTAPFVSPSPTQPARATRATNTLRLPDDVPTPKTCGNQTCEPPWEHPFTCPEDCPKPTTAPTPSATAPAATKTPVGYITFAVNVHDWRHVTESADTLMRLIALFEKYRVHGDFYLTGSMTQFYVEQRPDLVARLRDSGMTISYHTRPPHPLYTDFDSRLKKLSDAELKQTLQDYETYELDLATGDLIRSQPGGYSFVAATFGRKPVVVSPQNDDKRIRQAAQQLYAGLGAKMTVVYHETGTKIDRPFEYVNGLLVRPSDFSITRWPRADKPGDDLFWWNMLDTPLAADFDPTQHLQKELKAWTAPRPPFITVLIHENNFYRRDATPWDLVYFTDTTKKTPRTPPYDLNAPDPSHPRSAANMAQIWSAYESLVADAAAHLQVVTSEEIVNLAASSK